MFPDSGSHPVTPPFPRVGPGEPGSPRSAVLRRRYDFPLTHSRSLICFASRHRAISPLFVFASSALSCRSRPDPSPGNCSAGCPLAGVLSRERERDLPGSPAIRPMPLPRSTTPAGPTPPLPWRWRRCCPRAYHGEGPSILSFRGYSRGFSIRCLRFENGVAAVQARLATGWLAGLCREGVEPSGSR
jgi:hypothetical protein